ncbi:hypothetical protein A7P54_08205 [Acinetobacter sp. Ac_3412]|uniref:hypothetical protein n=1 Tax=Acinetobacter sp. Ac_3412 TaxID=1848935 RepID=UPI00149025BC|nr:hypothetical protein [Acinetobacter sp. Ac_3412]NNP76401.1 hypothetical protein [Acinetobacter sp. Ac_3412]
MNLIKFLLSVLFYFTVTTVQAANQACLEHANVAGEVMGWRTTGKTLKESRENLDIVYGMGRLYAQNYRYYSSLLTMAYQEKMGKSKAEKKELIKNFMKKHYDICMTINS